MTEDHPTATEHAAAPAQAGVGARPSNPFVIALVTLTVIFVAVAVVLYIVGGTVDVADQVPTDQASLYAVANSLIMCALIPFVGALVIGGVRFDARRGR